MALDIKVKLYHSDIHQLLLISVLNNPEGVDIPLKNKTKHTKDKSIVR